MAVLGYFKNIQRCLHIYAGLIEHSNSLGLLDETVEAEKLFCQLLNHLFKWNLIRASEEKFNQDTFDLIDDKNGIVVQVTSNKSHSPKLKKTVSLFKKNYSNKKFKRLIVLFVSTRCSKNVLKESDEGSFVYEGYDIRKLLDKIYSSCQSVSQLSTLNNLVVDRISPVIIKSIFLPSRQLKQKIGIPIQDSPIISKNRLYIGRQELISSIFHFVQENNGLLTGKPGVGKSFTIEELQRYCYSKNVPCFIIRINDLHSGSDEELTKELKTPKNWIDSLSEVVLKNKNVKSILIFDAFDTAKDENIKARVLKQIKDAIHQLKNHWSILVSVRTFDAEKSPQLQELFPNNNIKDRIFCRALEVPVLSDVEFINAINSTIELADIVFKCQPGIQSLLRIPYFLRLFEDIVADSKEAGNKVLLQADTEEQLLEIFWNKKISDNLAKDVLLSKLTKKLIDTANLSYPKASLISGTPDAKLMESLLSAGILTESSITKQNISFSHNILLEFAISKYLIQEDVDVLIKFIDKNEKLPFLFRQSFFYFFSKLWKYDNVLFWKHYYAFGAINKPLYRLTHQTILNYTLVTYYNKIDELDPILVVTNEEERGSIIKKVLETIRFTTKESIREQELALFLKISENIQTTFLWELGYLIHHAIKVIYKEREPDKKAISKVSEAALNYLSFVLNQRQTSSNKHLIENNGGRWGIQNVCTIFNANKTQASKLLLQVLDVLKEPDFPIYFIFDLSQYLPQLFEYDVKLSLKIYETLYLHVEDSDKQTFLGNSVVLGLKSNRRQDYELIHHKLEGDYITLIPIAPEALISLGIGIVNRVKVKNIHYRNTKNIFKLSIGDIQAKLIPDFSFIESAHDREYGLLSYLHKTFEYINGLIEQGEADTAQNLLDVILKKSEASIVWKEALKFLAKHPRIFIKQSFHILLNMEVYACNETVYESTELVKSLWQHLSGSDKRKLEKLFVNLDNSELFHKDAEVANRRIKRLLSCIPANDLYYPKSKNFIAEFGIAENKPLIEYSGLQSYTPSDEEYMYDIGVQPSNEKEKNIVLLTKTIDSFIEKFDNNNNAPTKDEYAPYLENSATLFTICTSGSLQNVQLLEQCDYTVSRYAKLISRNGNKINKDTRKLIEEIAFYYIHQERYKVATFQSAGLNDHFGAYAPSPRTVSVQILINLFNSDKSGKIAPLLFELMSDNVSIIRFKVLHTAGYFWQHHREDFWKMMSDRCAQESDGLVMHMLIKCICFDIMMKEDIASVENTADIIINALKGSDKGVNSDIWSCYTVLLLKLAINHNSAAALNIINTNLLLNEFALQLIYETRKLFEYYNNSPSPSEQEAKYFILITILTKIVKDYHQSIHDKKSEGHNADDDYSIIDRCVQHAYFAMVPQTNEKRVALTKEAKRHFYFKIKPLLLLILEESAKIDSGYMVAHTGYYFMQLMNNVLQEDTHDVLAMSAKIVKYASASGFTYDQTTLREVIKLAEHILADHKGLLLAEGSLNDLLTILDLFVNSGSQEALQVTWRLKDVF